MEFSFILDERMLTSVKEKYDKTRVEKKKDILKKIFNFEMKDDEACEQYWDRFQSLVSDCQRENISNSLCYLLSNMMIDKAVEKGKINVWR